MFTGIVEARGQIVATEAQGTGRRIRISYPGEGRLETVRLGDSIAVSGVCLTVSAMEEGCFDADLSDTTLERTTLGDLEAGHEVNLEPALRFGESIGGHLVSGHVDGVGVITTVEEKEGNCQVEVEAPLEIWRYLVPRGSICMDGISLTVTTVESNVFGVTLIPHTRAVSLAGGYRAGRRVNLEVDMLARYLERLIEERDRK